jgi:hypothetical protein
MTTTEAMSLKRGDYLEFRDPALQFCFFLPVRGVVMWDMRAGDGIGISWEGKPPVVHDPEVDFEHVRRAEIAAPI